MVSQVYSMGLYGMDAFPVQVEADLPRLENFLQADRHRGMRNAVDVAAGGGHRIDAARFAIERDDAGRQPGECIVVHPFARFRGIVERQVPGDADTAEGDVDAAAAFDQPGRRLRIARIAMGRIPRTGRVSPVSESSPRKTHSSVEAASWPLAFSRAISRGRS